ncbi:MAG: hypothetical protein P8X73_18395, partial [Ignavibacteriaceae bacterium]
MKNILKLFAFTILVISAEAHVKLDFPLGGETFTAGDTINIQWHVLIPHSQDNWDLFFSPDGGMTWEEIKLNISPTVLNYLWEVPRVITHQGRIK